MLTFSDGCNVACPFGRDAAANPDAGEERTAGDIAAKFAMTRPSVSQHLSVLLDSELVSVRRAGTRRFYRANRQAVARLRAELASLWDDSLARLKASAEASERKKRKR